MSVHRTSGPPEILRRREALLRAASTKSPHRKVWIRLLLLGRKLKKRAWPCATWNSIPRRSSGTREMFWLDDNKLKRLRARDVADLEGEAEALYKRTIAGYGELETLRKATLGDLAAGELFDLRQLSVEEAPEIVGRDVEGRQFKWVQPVWLQSRVIVSP